MRKKYARPLLSLFALTNLFCLSPVHAEVVEHGWNEADMTYKLTRKIPTAINVYAAQGTIPQVQYEEGTISDVKYSVLRVDPSDKTFLRVDYSETPVWLRDLKDATLVESGYQRVGGINAGYFYNGDFEYGRPVGGVRVDDSWVRWNGSQVVPDYGHGFASAYFNTCRLDLRYHGYSSNGWQGDKTYNPDTNKYVLTARNGISGSYTYMADGKMVDITNGDHGDVNYHSYGRAVTILAQDSYLQYLLINIYGTVPESAITEFLRKNDVVNAIRMDGGGSTQMVYDDALVNLPYEKSDYCELNDDSPTFGELSRERKIIRDEDHERHIVKVLFGDLRQAVPVRDGADLVIKDREGEEIGRVDSVNKDMTVLLEPKLVEEETTTVKSADAVIEYNNRFTGQINGLLSSENENETIAVVSYDNVLPIVDFTVNVFDESNKLLWSYTGRETVNVDVYNSTLTKKQTLTFAEDKNIRVKPSSKEKGTFLEWAVVDEGTHPKFYPVFEREEEPRQHSLFEESNE